jgi:hypothetical protein
MKPTLAIVFLLAAGASASGQTPTVQPALKPGATKAKPAVVSAKPSPANVKVVPVPAQKPGSAAVKPNVVHVAAQPTPATVKVTPAKPGVSTKPVASQTKPMSSHPAPVAVRVQTAGQEKKAPATTVKVQSAEAPRAKDPFHAEKKVAFPSPAAAPTGTKVAVKEDKPAADKKRKFAETGQNGRRDPFVSPVVNVGVVGSGCSSGKRCLTIDQIAVKGIVKSDTGMIAVVVNAVDKAYFLRENDPVFNGYVLKITGDTVVFKESYKDRLGKALTRDITKSISRPTA